MGFVIRYWGYIFNVVTENIDIIMDCSKQSYPCIARIEKNHTACIWCRTGHVPSMPMPALPPQWSRVHMSERLKERCTRTQRVRLRRKCTTTSVKCRVHSATSSPAVTVYTRVQKTAPGAMMSRVNVRYVIKCFISFYFNNSVITWIVTSS